jgi:hypothetical protein
MKDDDGIKKDELCGLSNERLASGWRLPSLLCGGFMLCHQGIALALS